MHVSVALLVTTQGAFPASVESRLTTAVPSPEKTLYPIVVNHSRPRQSCPRLAVVCWVFALPLVQQIQRVGVLGWYAHALVALAIAKAVIDAGRLFGIV